MLSGVPSLLFSLEMRSDSLSQRVISIESGISIFDIRLGKINKTQLELIKSTANKIKELPLYLDTTFYVTPEYLTNTIRRYKKLHDIKVVYLDYIQLMIERSANATHDIGKVTRDLKLLANELDITVVMASQLNRGVEGRENKRPLLSDIRQSGNIEEDADVVIGLYRDIIYNQNTNKPKEIELIIMKQRQGPTGTIFENFDDTTNKIYDTKDK
jgi:replicative DNA helicase